MKQTWRWFGPSDNTSISDARQAGAEAIVSALHHIASGEIWPISEIKKRQDEVQLTSEGNPSGLKWDVVESLPVHENIKTQSGHLDRLFDNYRSSLKNLAHQGIKTICYNFMPVLDWTRTNLAYPLENGAKAMYFDLIDFSAFDLYILQRDGAENDYSDLIVNKARQKYAAMDAQTKNKLTKNITAGLPGAVESWSLSDLADKLEDYQNISPEQLHQNHVDFLNEITPTTEKLGMRLCCHPDDPPFSLLGLPRIMSTASDYRRLLQDVNSPSVGMTFCSGSLGARHDNNLPQMVKEFGPRIFFAHLRNVRRLEEQIPCSFFEDEHLGGQTNMVALVRELLREEARRRAEGREDHIIPMRPDHGHDILSDNGSQPGYPTIGRLKGLAEMRGVMAAVEQSLQHKTEK
ncbi:MAG: mannonate dehydratase [Alphaproteobacteria bacterium]|nr:MAG: mannonate dehydratase [Alphaproteobacteria bacterium]